MRSGLRAALIAGLALLWMGAAHADRLELIRHVNLWDETPVRSSDASGITYHAPSGHLLIADSEISEYGESLAPDGELVFQGFDIFEVQLGLAAEPRCYLTAAAPDGRREPTGIAYNPLDGHVYVADDNQKKLYRYQFDGDVRFGEPLAQVSTSVGGRYSDPEGLVCDPKTGVLYVCSGTQEEKVIMFRFDAEADSFEYLGEFPVHEHIQDPEGIGFEPVTGNLFIVCRNGIAEFRPDGRFVQYFDHADIPEAHTEGKLTGGLTFAPSSDPNDHPDTWSIYMTYRGIDNGKFPEQNTLDGAVAELRLVREQRVARPILVPADHATIQGALDAAGEGDTIVVSPGVYDESVVFTGAAVTLVSEHFLSGDADVIGRTVIDGGGRDFAVRVDEGTGPGPVISGFTIRNADDGITASGHLTLTHCHVTGTTDGIDYEGGGGLLRYCRFTENRDDGIDLDGPTAATIEHCDISDNGDDGIEIRLHPYTGDMLSIVVRNCMIARNGEDGIQLIDYDTVSSREFLFEGNTITGNAMAGIGCMGGAVTKEDYTGAPIAEQILLFHTTFSDNDHHLTGGANLLAANNIFAGARTLAVKNTAGNSLFARNLFWGNEAREENSSIDLRDAVVADPLLDDALRPLPGSPAVDAGASRVLWRGTIFTPAAPCDIRGYGPDIGAWE